jgi:acetyl esterase/lipase
VVAVNDEAVELLGERLYRGQTFRVVRCPGGSENILVWFHGGCFIQEKYDTILPFLVEVARVCEMDVVTFDYPLLYTATMPETLGYCNQLLRDFFDEHKYENVFYGGDSAGTYLALKTMEIEYNQSLRTAVGVEPLGIPVNGFVGICGFYDPTLNGKPLALPLINHWFWKADNITNYKKCSVRVPSLLVSSSHDFLVSQTQRFIDQQPRRLLQFRQFVTPNSLHCFVANTTLLETIQTLELMCDFFSRNRRSEV